MNSENNEKSTGDQIKEVGEAIQAVGVLLTILITIPYLLYVFFSN